MQKIDTQEPFLEELKIAPDANKATKKAVFIIAFRDFRDEEYFVPKNVLEQAGIEVSTASDNLGVAIGSLGGEANVDILINNLTTDNFDAILFIGGSGALKHLDNQKSYKASQEAIKKNKVLGAICISPVILAKAGILQNKKATVWSSPLDKSTVRILENNGAIYEDKNVVVDGKIITANGPEAIQEFGKKIVELLSV